ncbi:MAG: hypothetical protein ISR69_09055 [Gammaproteobacteria bacterium]|nr:hypothetical protein [Gammaproteobacteria bacterium]
MKIALIIISSLLVGCATQYKMPPQRFIGDFSYYKGIAEYFDCSTKKRYFMDKGEAYSELVERYEALNLRAKEDIYIRSEGYLKEEELIDGLDPVEVFVVTKIVRLDPNRGCNLVGKEGL